MGRPALSIKTRSLGALGLCSHRAKFTLLQGKIKLDLCSVYFIEVLYHECKFCNDSQCIVPYEVRCPWNAEVPSPSFPYLPREAENARLTPLQHL